VQQRLQERIRAARSQDGGFTLIELLIVIVILGILAGVVVFSVQFITTRGEKAACQTDLKNVQSAIEAYYAQFGSNPTTIADLVARNVLKSGPTSDNYIITIDPNHIAVANLRNPDGSAGAAGCPTG
jgi:prepilin-type N-terminal cleavage/methylation domain-containing protein